MWNTSQVLYEGTKDVKDFKINTMIEEYELFCMEPGVTVESMQSRFLHLINKLEILEKSIHNKDCANKILRYMSRE